MQRCPRCGAPNAARICWHCGHDTAIDSDQPAADEQPKAVSAAVPYPPLIPPSPPKARPRGSRRLLMGASAAALFIVLSIVIGARSLSSRPTPQPVTVAAPAPVRSLNSDSPATVEPVTRPTWVGRRQPVWAYDGTKTVTFALDALADVTMWTSRTRPQLVARCLSHTTEVFVVTGPLSFEPQTGSHTVHVQVDDDPEQTQQWLNSEASKELFAPDGLALSDRLSRAHRLRVGFTPFNAKPVTAEFIVDGFDELAPMLARTCAWRPSPPAR